MTEKIDDAIKVLEEEKKFLAEEEASEPKKRKGSRKKVVKTEDLQVRSETGAPISKRPTVDFNIGVTYYRGFSLIDHMRKVGELV